MFKHGDRVVVADQRIPQGGDHVGTVVGVEPDGTVLVQWAGPEAPDEPGRFSPRMLRPAD